MGGCVLGAGLCVALGDMVKLALDTSKLKEFTGRESPTVIT